MVDFIFTIKISTVAYFPIYSSIFSFWEGKKNPSLLYISDFGTNNVHDDSDVMDRIWMDVGWGENEREGIVESNISDMQVYIACVYVNHFICVQLFVTLCSVAHPAPLSIGFSRQEYWSGLPCPPPGDLQDPGVKPSSLTFPRNVGRFFTTSIIWK